MKIWKLFFYPRELVGLVTQPSLDLTECLEDDDVEGGEDDDGAELGGDERVDAVEGGVVPAVRSGIATGKYEAFLTR